MFTSGFEIPRRIQIDFGAIVCGLLLLLGGVTAHAASGGKAGATIVYTGNLDGELEPCGCSLEGDFGGMRRQATLIDRLRRERPNLFFISSGGLLRSESVHDRLTGEYILKGTARLKYDAIGVQWPDLAYGMDFIRKDALPWVASNWPDTFHGERRVTRGGKMLVFFNWIDPGASPLQQMGGMHGMTAPQADTAMLAEALRRAKAEGALTVLASTLGSDEARALLPLQHVDVLLIRSAYEKYGEPKMLDHTLVLQPGSRGQRFGRLDVVFDGAGAIQSWKHQVIAMPNTVPDARRMKTWYREYNARVKADYEKGVKIAKAQQAGQSPYAGALVCQSCHAEQHKIWDASRHAHAYDKLRRVNKAFDPNCIVCHTVGFNKPGGFIDGDSTANLANVQCESCHGSARAHAESGGAKPVGNAGWQRERMCAQCHVPAHSPSFNVDVYWPKIMHSRGAGGK